MDSDSVVLHIFKRKKLTSTIKLIKILCRKILEMVTCLQYNKINADLLHIKLPMLIRVIVVGT